MSIRSQLEALVEQNLRELNTMKRLDDNGNQSGLYTTLLYSTQTMGQILAEIRKADAIERVCGTLDQAVSVPAQLSAVARQTFWLVRDELGKRVTSWISG